MVYDQHEFDIRCEWGLQGVHQLAPISDAIIIIDVLSFSTCVDIAVSNGAVVYPYASRGEAASEFAVAQNAILASHDRKTEGFSLSPASLLSIPQDTRLVLPSPNGSTLSMATGHTPTFAACLRNARVVAEAVQEIGSKIAIIPAGERWWKTDMSLRPALEDLIGAGAIIHHLSGNKSPEALMAENAFLQFADDLYSCLSHIGSGKELIEKGFPEDVELAATLNVSGAVPMLKRGAYHDEQ